MKSRAAGSTCKRVKMSDPSRAVFKIRSRVRGLAPVCLVAVAICLAACSAGSTSAAGRPAGTPADVRPDGAAHAPAPTPPSNYVRNGTGNSTVEQAHARLLDQGNKVYLIIVSSQSTGVEGDIYRDLRKRDFRATVGPDEGIDTHSEFCYPDCLFVPVEEVNAISADAWVLVLKHEYRHITQARNNSNMAKDFRDSNGMFTTYAAFSEACADYGLNVAPVYQAQSRMDQLESALGAGQQGVIDKACGGDKGAYQQVMQEYDQKVGSGGFAQLFPPYQ